MLWFQGAQASASWPCYVTVVNTCGTWLWNFTTTYWMDFILCGHIESRWWSTPYYLRLKTTICQREVILDADGLLNAQFLADFDNCAHTKGCLVADGPMTEKKAQRVNYNWQLSRQFTVVYKLGGPWKFIEIYVSTCTYCDTYIDRKLFDFGRTFLVKNTLTESFLLESAHPWREWIPRQARAKYWWCST